MNDYSPKPRPGQPADAVTKADEAVESARQALELALLNKERADLWAELDRLRARQAQIELRLWEIEKP